MTPPKVVFAKEYLQRLYASLSRWETYHKYYVQEFVPQLQQALAGKDAVDLKDYSKNEIALMRALQGRLDAEEWNNLAHSLELLYQGQKVNFASDARLQQRLQELLQCREQLAEREQALQAYCDLPAKLKQRQILRVQQQLQQQAGQLAKREQLMLQTAARIEELQQQQQLRLEQAQRELKQQQTQRLRQLLEQDFLHFFQAAADIDNLQYSKQELEQLRLDFVRDWCWQQLQLRVDEQQARAIAHHQGHVLVEARAGSGKTRVLVSRAIFLIKHCKLEAASMLLLAFNRNAARTMYQRLQQHLHKDLPHVMTFHALALRICVNRMPELTGLRLQEDHGDQQSKLKQQLKQIIEQSLQQLPAKGPSGVAEGEPDFELWRGIVRQTGLQQHELLGSVQNLLLEYFTQDSDYFDTLDEYFAQKNGQKTVNPGVYKDVYGKSYDSYMAAQLANFAVEHELHVRKLEPPGSLDLPRGCSWLRIYHGRSKQQVLVLVLPAGHGRNVVLLKELLRRNYTYHKSCALLLQECSFASREQLHEYFRQCLADLQLPLHKLSPQQLWKKLHGQIIRSFCEVCADFIARAIKYDLHAVALQQRIEAHQCLNRAEEVFLQCIQPLYAHYLELRARQEPDFDRLCQLSCEFLSQPGAFTYRCQFSEQQRLLQLDRLEFVSVDEFQDFNELFYQMLRALGQACKQQQLFAVGDNWQAINAFAGSNLCYFENFADYFPKASKLYLTTNYRSAEAIVDLGNRLMQGRGEPALAHNKSPAAIYLWDLQQFKLDQLEQAERGGGGANSLAAACSCASHGSLEQTCEFTTGSGTQASSAATVEADSQNCWNKVRRHVNYHQHAGFVALLHAVAGLYRQDRQLLLLGRKNDVPQDYALPALEPEAHPFESETKKKAKPLSRTLWEQRLCSYFAAAAEDSMPLRQSTVHSCKGDESEEVLLTDLFRGHFPLVKKEWMFQRVLGVDLADLIDEERRLLYVALTRAKQQLGIIHDSAKPSPFLASLGLQQCAVHDWRYCYRQFVAKAGYASLRLMGNAASRQHALWLERNGFTAIYHADNEGEVHYLVKDIEAQHDYLAYLQEQQWPDLHGCILHILVNDQAAQQGNRSLRFSFDSRTGWQAC